MPVPLLPTVCLPLCLPSCPPQDAAVVLATYVVAGRPAVATAGDVAIEIAHHLRRRDRGPQAIEQLVASHLTREIARRRNLLPTEAEVRAFWRELQDQLRAAGRRPEEFAAVRNTSEAQWLADLAVQMAQERIVRAELGLSPKDRVSGDMLELWLKETRRQARVVDDPDQLPAGVAVRVDGVDVPMLELGLLLLRTAEDDERERFVRQVVYLHVLEATAREAGVRLTDADLDAAVRKRRDEVARDERYRGVTFEGMLQAQGLSVAALRELRTFRAQVLLDRLAAVRFPTPALAAELVADRQRVLDRVGPRRRLGVLFLRSLAEPNALVPRSHDEARRQLEAARERLGRESWDDVVRSLSDHSGSKLSGGDIGWHTRASTRLPEALLAAAFALPLDAVSSPLCADDGCYLVKVLDIDAEPTDDELLARWREWKAQELSQRLLDDAQIEFVKPEARR
jgi:hypothetical protein